MKARWHKKHTGEAGWGLADFERERNEQNSGSKTSPREHLLNDALYIVGLPLEDCLSFSGRLFLPSGGGTW